MLSKGVEKRVEKKGMGVGGVPVLLGAAKKASRRQPKHNTTVIFGAVKYRLFGILCRLHFREVTT